ncbi:MAG: hypothetical protein ACTSVB_04085 [Candidatus Heimdallarchaeaceae archaeon]
MIAKVSWFKRRKYGGWGVSPKTWQGWVYIALMILPFIIFQALPYWNTETRLYVTLGWVIFLMLDILPIMVTLKRDEKEYKNEAIAERNSALFMVMVLVIGLLYEIITSALRQDLQINWFLAVALFGGALVKTISNIYLDKKGI